MYYNKNKKGNGGEAVEQNICPVDVIAMCSANGDIRPLRFRMEDESHQLLRIHIDEIISIKEIEYVGVEGPVFLCRARVWERQWVFELKYNIRSHSWCILRKVG